MMARPPSGRPEDRRGSASASTALTFGPARVADRILPGQRSWSRDHEAEELAEDFVTISTPEPSAPTWRHGCGRAARPWADSGCGRVPSGTTLPGRHRVTAPTAPPRTPQPTHFSAPFGPPWPTSRSNPATAWSLEGLSVLPATLAVGSRQCSWSVGTRGAHSGRWDRR